MRHTASEREGEGQCANGLFVERAQGAERPSDAQKPQMTNELNRARTWIRGERMCR